MNAAISSVATGQACWSLGVPWKFDDVWIVQHNTGRMIMTGIEKIGTSHDNKFTVMISLTVRRQWIFFAKHNSRRISVMIYQLYQCQDGKRRFFCQELEADVFSYSTVLGIETRLSAKLTAGRSISNCKKINILFWTETYKIIVVNDFADNCSLFWSIVYSRMLLR